jgi:glycogen debranching enzyme
MIQDMPTQDKKLSSNLVIQVEDHFYILASSSLVDQRTRVLKHNDLFSVMDRFGDVQAVGAGQQGLYFKGTRYISRWVLTLHGERPLLLSSAIKEDNAILTIDLTNSDLYDSSNSRVEMARGSLHVFRAHFLMDGCWYQHLRVRNYGLEPFRAEFAFQWEADFHDIFEVRGIQRPKRGSYLKPEIKKNEAILSYQGLDNLIRKTRIQCLPGADEIDAKGARFQVNLKPMEDVDYFITIACLEDDEESELVPYKDAWEKLQKTGDEVKTKMCEIVTSNPQCNTLVRRSLSDLSMMITETPEGRYPFAGVPWFSAPFGRDGIITAMECLWMYPNMAKGVLAYLAKTQAKDFDEFRDAQPGKILHERREGEMAALKEIPFGMYYGSVDSTPLFLMLAASYFERTADLELIRSIWPNIEAAMNWIDQYGDLDQDGFVEYYRLSPTGLSNQGWKDSHDSIFHEDGTLARGPIALCEVQGYVYAAKRGAAQLASRLGFEKKAAEWFSEAERLQENFQQAFWMDDLNIYALALDCDKKPCRVRSSNAGHALFTEIASRAHAKKIVHVMMGSMMYSGWGIRTISTNEARYNPMSYHNGSVWPHDNAMIAAGFQNYGFKEETCRVLNGFYDTSLFLDLYRLPELFCGFDRRSGEAPVEYPVACSPQSWAAASILMMFQAALGISIQAEFGRVEFDRPVLPDFIQEIKLLDVQVGRHGSVDILLERYHHDVGVNVMRKNGNIDVVINK